MILAFDVGNTNMVLGTIDNGVIGSIARVHTEPKNTAAEYGIQLRQLIEYYDIDLKKIEGAIICSVVPTVTDALQEAVQRLTGLNCMAVGPGIRTGMNVRIDDPTTLAGDLVVGSVAAIAYYGTPAIVLDMDTATTMAVVDEKNCYRGGVINCVNTIKSVTKIDLYENITINADGSLKMDSNLSLLVPKHVSMMLCNYSKLKESAYSKFNSDIYYMMLALDEITEEALANYPLYRDLLIYKIDGLQNVQIQTKLQETYDITYSIEYISSLWRNKIPKLIAETAEKKWLVWHYTEEEKGVWKKCSKCGQIKLAHTKFFSKNKTSKDGYYSICKDCRNKKKGV